MFENKKTKVQGIHYSRYIASWANIERSQRNAHVYFDEIFKGWLRFNECTEEEIQDICEMANCGKMELEKSGLAYLDSDIPKKILEECYGSLD